MLSPNQLAARAGKLTASRVACLMTGDKEAIFNLWRVLIGDCQESDMSDVWPVQLGVATESLQVDWFERKHGPVSRRGDVVTPKWGDWAAATLDGWSDTHDCPIEVKHCGGHEPFEVVRERYQPQMHWQMLVTDASKCALSVIMGAREPVVEFVDCDDEYAAELMRRAEAFMQCVREFRAPVELAPVAAPLPPGKTYDFTGRNEWAAEAATWRENIEGKKKAEGAEKTLKAIVPTDAIKCFGHGVQITRNRAGALSLREMSK